MAAHSSSLSLKEYLKRYQSFTDEPKKSKKKKKEKLKPQSTSGGVRVVDEDPVWQKPVQFEDEYVSAGDETPQIEEDIEVKRMKRLETLRSLKPYHGIREDGSGWVSIAKQNQHDSGITDLFPARYQQRPCLDSPSRSDLDESTDLSLPRQRQDQLDTPSPEPHFNESEREARDLSPPSREHIADLSPPSRAKFHRQEVEAGPGLHGADISSPRNSKGTLLDDLSPPRRSLGSTEANRGPYRRPMKGSYDDLSPPTLDPSSSSSDLSPPRSSTKQHPDDLSPPRRAQKHSLKPTEVQSSSFLDISTTRGHHGSSPKQALSRSACDESTKSNRNKDLPPPVHLVQRNKELSFTKMARRGGLLSSTEMREEIDKKKKDDKSRFASMDPLFTGRDAEAVHRDKEGRKISKEELNKPNDEKKEPKPLEWGKGLAQKKEAEERWKELELEKERPFARSRDDPELDMMLKERVRWGDPMAHLVKRKSSELIVEDLGENEKMKESGFVIPQTIPSHSWLKRGLDFLPNRYGIRPGRHWDGVDRSNGYEKELYKRQNEKRAMETEAYLWSVSDM